MEKLIIKNFANIEKIDIEIKGFTLIIGPQASGKSVVSKVLYFFKDIILDEIKNCIQNSISYLEFKKQIVLKFEEIFPKYSWENRNFTIEYINNDTKIKVYNKKISKGYSLKVELDSIVKSFYDSVRKEYKVNIKNSDDDIRFYQKDMLLIDAFKKYAEDYQMFFESSTYIPAGRSFFSTLKANVFGFISENIGIDIFLKEFGKSYELSKRLHEMKEKFLNKKLKKVESYFADILKGQFTIVSDEEWIETNNQKIKISNASSGQQEALPMLLVMTYLPFLGHLTKKSSIFVEEPEAHIFPTSQKVIIDLLGYIYNANKEHMRYIVTTHSPYILASLNNLIMKNIATDGKNGINPKDVSVIVMSNGKSRSAIDKATKLINGEILDSVSNKLEKEFDDLLSKTVN